MKSLLIIAIFWSLTTEAAAFKAAYIDMQSAIQATSAGKAAKKKLEAEFNKRKVQLQKKENGIKKEAEAFEKKRMVYSEKVRAEKRDALQKKMMGFQQELGKSQAEIQKKERDLTQPIVVKLQKVIAKVAKKNSYSMVFEKAANGVMYAESGLDITKTVVKEFETTKKL